MSVNDRKKEWMAYHRIGRHELDDKVTDIVNASVAKTLS